MIRTVTACAAVVLLAACAPRGSVSMVPDLAARDAGASVGTIFVATDRASSGGARIHGGDRVAETGYARFGVAVPPDREKGSIVWPRGAADPATDFVLVSAALLDRDGFLAGIDRALAAHPAGRREVLLFVHGFNTNYPEAFYRQAQMMHDFGTEGVGVTYAWASAASAFGYVHDRDSVLFARDGLVRLLMQLRQSRADRVVIVAHSMGALLVMEALRSMALAGDAPPWGKLGGVFLVSPDLAVDVFLSQAAAIGTLPQPFGIFTSRQDRALRLSAGLSGQADRLGSMPDAAQVADVDVTVYNLDRIDGGDALHHMTALSSPASIAILSQMRELSRQMAASDMRRQGLIPGTVLSIRNATEVILTQTVP